jgi:hypothetical protein
MNTTALERHDAVLYRTVLLDRAGGVRIGGQLQLGAPPGEGAILRYAGGDWRVLELDGDELMLEPA